MNGSMDFMVVPYDDGAVELFAPGQFPAGEVVANAAIINVSGPGLPAAPNGRLIAQQYQEWVSRLQAQGYRVTARQK